MVIGNALRRVVCIVILGVFGASLNGMEPWFNNSDSKVGDTSSVRPVNQAPATNS